MTASESPLDRSRLTFSQAEGLAPLPSQLKLGELSREFRSVLWGCLVEELERASGTRFYVGGVWEKILRDAHVLLYHEPADEFDLSLDKLIPPYKERVWAGLFNEIFDFFQFVMRHPSCEREFVPRVRGMLKYCRTAYGVLDQGPTIVPIGSAEEVKTLIDAFAATKHPAFPGAGTHLRLAVEALNSGRYGDSVRESVHAVESAARGAAGMISE